MTTLLLLNDLHQSAAACRLEVNQGPTGTLSATLRGVQDLRCCSRGALEIRGDAAAEHPTPICESTGVQKLTVQNQEVPELLLLLGSWCCQSSSLF